MNTSTFIKGVLLGASFTLLMMTAAMANASETETSKLPTLVHPIKRGDIVTADMLSSIQVKPNQVTSYVYKDQLDVIGKEAVRSVRSGYPLYKKQFRTVPAVRKGQSAMVVFQKAGITLTTEGLVMKDAAAGEIVKFINQSSKRSLTGLVQEDGTIMVN